MVHHEHMTPIWLQRLDRDRGRVGWLLALVVAQLLMLVSDLAHIDWLDWLVAAGYAVAIGLFVRQQVISYRRTAQRFPIPPRPPV